MASLNPLFTSHMVFAAEKPIRIFGDGEGAVEISFCGAVAKTVGTADGWSVELPPMGFGGPYTLTARLDGKELCLEDIYVGRVFLMAGQSNMQFKLAESAFSKEDYRSNPLARLFVAPRPEENEPYTPADGWIVSAQDNLPNWSALAYHVGHTWAEDGVAVGLIGCYQGASVIESWLPEGTLARLGISIPLDKKSKDHSENRYKAWNGDGALYRKSLSGLFPFSLSAVVWYQGESNYYPAESKVYKKELTEMIRIWRESFRDGELPFVIVQIANYINRAGEGWSNIQKAQYDIQFEVPSVKTAISADVSEDDNIHPPTKIHLAARISQALDSIL